jgi:hypothetical protein
LVNLNNVYETENNKLKSILLIEKNDSQTDEGYVEQRFDEPPFMNKWTDDQKAGNNNKEMHK